LDNIKKESSELKSLIANSKIADLIGSYFSNSSDSLKNSNEIQNSYAYLLSTIGWYVSGNMLEKDVFMIFLSLKRGEIKSAEDILMKYYRKNQNKIKNDLIKLYPEKIKIIAEAFTAHRKSLYFASTILSISIADGICEGKFFRSKKYIKNYLLTKNSPDIVEAVLTKQSAIDADTRNLDNSNYFSDLNRHGIMHGLQWEYGDEKNSLKALSLLCFISDFVDRKANVK